MHGVNLDLLRATSTHHPDGRPRDAHAHHRTRHRAARRKARKARLHHLIVRLARAVSGFRKPKVAPTCPAR